MWKIINDIRWTISVWSYEYQHCNALSLDDFNILMKHYLAYRLNITHTYLICTQLTKYCCTTAYLQTMHITIKKIKYLEFFHSIAFNALSLTINDTGFKSSVEQRLKKNLHSNTCNTQQCMIMRCMMISHFN